MLKNHIHAAEKVRWARRRAVLPHKGTSCSRRRSYRALPPPLWAPRSLSRAPPPSVPLPPTTPVSHARSRPFFSHAPSPCPSRPTDVCSCFRLKLSRFHSMEPALSDSLPCTSCCPSLSHYCPESCHFWSLLPQMSLLPSFPQEPPLCVMCSPTRRRRQCSPIWEPLASSLWLLNT